MEFAFKLIVVGDSGAGKSNLALRFCDNLFFHDSVPTLGIDFKYTTCETIPEMLSDEDDKKGNADYDAASSPVSVSSSHSHAVRLQVWDTAGHDRFAALTAGFYRNCQGIALCFDLTNRMSFEHLDSWYGRLTEQIGRDLLPPLVLIGCKLDLVTPPSGLLSADATSPMPQRNASRSRPGTSSPPPNLAPAVAESVGLCSPNPNGVAGATGLLLRGSNFAIRQVESCEAETWARDHDAVMYIETSAKDGTNVAFAFRCLATAMVRKALNAQPPCDSGPRASSISSVLRRSVVSLDERKGAQSQGSRPPCSC